MEYFKLTKTERKEQEYPTKTPFIIRQAGSDSYYFVSKDSVFGGSFKNSDRIIITHMGNGIVQSSAFNSIKELFESEYNFRLVNSEIIVSN